MFVSTITSELIPTDKEANILPITPNSPTVNPNPKTSFINIITTEAIMAIVCPPITFLGVDMALCGNIKMVNALEATATTITGLNKAFSKIKIVKRVRLAREH